MKHAHVSRYMKLAALGLSVCLLAGCGSSDSGKKETEAAATEAAASEVPETETDETDVIEIESAAAETDAVEPESEAAGTEAADTEIESAAAEEEETAAAEAESEAARTEEIPATESEISTAEAAESEEEIVVAEPIELLNVSYDPTREFYEAYNEMFCSYYEETTGVPVTVTQSHGGSGSQARSVIEGNEADVVTLALAHDITLLEQEGMIDEGWMDEFDNNSAPYTSTIVFLVRSGNEKDIQDWDDLIREGVDVITPDPKSSGGACWNFLAAWYYAEQQYGEDEDQIKDFMSALYDNVLVMDSGARGATTTFVENGQGDVLIAWENEALQSMAEYPGEYELITPSVSILAEPSVAVVDENVALHGTEEAATAYLQYLYTDEAQRLIGTYYYRPSNEEILQEFSDTFDLDIDLCTIDDFGGWDQAYADFFVDDGIFDEVYLY